MKQSGDWMGAPRPDETKRRLLAVDGAGEFFAKTPDEFIAYMRSKPKRMEWGWAELL